jgi:hypothetical protein
VKRPILGLYFMHAVNYVHSNVWKEHTSSIIRMTKLVQVDDKMLWWKKMCQLYRMSEGVLVNKS